MTGSLESGLTAFVAREAAGAVTALSLTRLPGGTMRHAWALDVELAGGPLAGRHRLIYLPDRGGAPLDTRLGREAEFRVLAAMHGAGVRVPRPYFCVRAGDPTGLAAGLVVERVDGETLARRILRDPGFETGRARLLGQVGQELARIHAVSPAIEGLPRPGRRTPAEYQLAQMDQTLGAMSEPHPVLELALRRLGRRPPRTAREVVVHSDYRLGNFVVDKSEGLRAVLDWELAHGGDPGEDLAWVVIRYWRAVDRPGEPGLGPRARLLDAYGLASGLTVDPEWLDWWEVFANLRWAVVTLRQAERHLKGQERGLELAAIGRHCAEVEWELTRLLARV